MPVGSHIVPTATTAGGVRLVAGYKYSGGKRAVQALSTVGAGSTKPGSPHVNRFADKETGQVRIRDVRRPQLLFSFFLTAPSSTNSTSQGKAT